MKKKTSELIGPALDWAVAKCEGIKVGICLGGYLALQASIEASPHSAKSYSPSRDWAQGGPISERGGIWAHTTDEGVEDTSCLWRAELPYVAVEVGPTELIAKMRCFVAAKLGDEVVVPSELL